jgi:biotin carboxyl carrier protein
MSERVKMPALGESVTEGTVTRWLKGVGDTVEIDEPLLEVSTDKVDTEIPSPIAGTLQEILVQEDDTVPVGADLAVIGDGDAPAASEPEAAPAEAAPEPAPVEAEAAPAEAAPAPAPAESAPAEQAAPQGSADTSSDGGDGTTVTMPALGESVTEGTVTRWLKQEGDDVEVDEPLLEVSTDKVDTEIPSPVAGKLNKILVQEDDTVPVGADLAVIGGSGGGSAPAAAAEAPAPEPAAAAPAPAAPAPAPAAPAPASAAPAPAAPAPHPLLPPRCSRPGTPAPAPAAGTGSCRSRGEQRRHRGPRCRGLRHAARAQAGRRPRHRPRDADRHRDRWPHPQAGRHGGRRGQEGPGSCPRGTGTCSGRTRRARQGTCGHRLAPGHHREDVPPAQDDRPPHGRVAPDLGAAHHGRRGRRHPNRQAARPGQGRLRRS